MEGHREHWRRWVVYCACWRDLPTTKLHLLPLEPDSKLPSIPHMPFPHLVQILPLQRLHWKQSLPPHLGPATLPSLPHCPLQHPQPQHRGSPSCLGLWSRLWLVFCSILPLLPAICHVAVIPAGHTSPLTENQDSLGRPSGLLPPLSPSHCSQDVCPSDTLPLPFLLPAGLFPLRWISC